VLCVRGVWTPSSHHMHRCNALRHGLQQCCHCWPHFSSTALAGISCVNREYITVASEACAKHWPASECLAGQSADLCSNHNNLHGTAVSKSWFAPTHWRLKRCSYISHQPVCIRRLQIRGSGRRTKDWIAPSNPDHVAYPLHFACNAAALLSIRQRPAWYGLRTG
jgi:hypothetical protein